ncbi:MAG TPA: hypothetical protein VMZ28_15340 [Kofleriaceae bacterium]|nr:hypothetical protein [Kofleriaceae bacterium]
MTHLTSIARILLGLAFTAFSINYFVPFLPAPSEAPPADALAFLGVFAGSGMLTLVKLFELAAGVLLLTNRFVPLALALLAPILVGINAYHLLLAPAGVALPLVLLALEVALAWRYRAAFAPMLRARTSPAPAREAAAPHTVAHRLG